MPRVSFDGRSSSVLRSAMSRLRPLLYAAYLALALLALFATWHQNLSYFRPEDGRLLGPILATGRFWPDAFANPATISITVDIALFFMAAAIFMVVEARRLQIRFVWAYIVLGLLVAISVTFPLFLIARERRLAARSDAAASAVELTRGDAIGLGLFAALSIVVSLWTFWR